MTEVLSVSPETTRWPRTARVAGFMTLLSVPLVAWSRDLAVATLILAVLSLALQGAARPPSPARVSPAVAAMAFILLWSFASIFWAPHLPWDAWLKTAVIVTLGLAAGRLLMRQSGRTLDLMATPAIWGALALVLVLVIERLTDGALIGLHRQTETVFQRLTALTGGLVLACCTCFAVAAVMARFIGALVAVPLWTGVILAVSLAYPMDAEVAALLSGAFVFAAVFVGGRKVAIAAMILLGLVLAGWGFAAEAAAGAGLHQWLIANVDPNWGYRVEIWRYVSELTRGRIVEGYGFDAARVLGASASLMPSFQGKTSFLHPHNGMLQIWLELGLVGVAGVLLAAGLGFKSFLNRAPNRFALATVCATVTACAAIWSLSFGAWQGWWVAVLAVTAVTTTFAVRVIGAGTRAPERKRLLFLVTEFYFFDALKKELTHGARAQGYDIYVIGRCRPEDLTRDHDGITVIPFEWKRSPSILVSLVYFIPDLIRVGRLLGAVDPHVLHNIALKPAIVGSLAAIGRDIRVINAIHGFGFLFFSRSLLAHLVQAGCGYVLKLSAHANDALLLVINRHDLALARDRMRIPSAQIQLVHGTGIDLSRFGVLPDPPAPPFRFLVIGRLLYMKGIQVVVDAHRRLRERGIAAELIVCGAPDADNPSSIPEEVLAAWAALPEVTFTGQVSDVRPYLASCHVLVHPSLGGEGLPRALSEAAASGRALIATDIPGNTEVVIAHETGLLVPANDAQAMADAMAWMIAHPAERLAYVRNGRAMMEREFSSEAITRVHAGFYPAEKTGAPYLELLPQAS